MSVYGDYIVVFCNGVRRNVMEGKHETEVDKCNNQNDEAKSDSKQLHTSMIKEGTGYESYSRRNRTH